MLKKTALVLVVLILGVLAFATTKPDSFKVQREIDIKAPPDKVLAYLHDFHQWQAWSPWEKLDPAMQRTHSGAAAGKGAVYEWKGNSDVGQGRMEVLEVTPPLRVLIKLDFIEPIEGHNLTEFVIEPMGDVSHLTWHMSGPMPYVSKLMSVFVSMDTMIGPDFEKGLSQLKAAAEK